MNCGMACCSKCPLPVSTAILLATVPVAMSAETEITPPDVFIQQHHEHSPRSYSNPVALATGKLIRYGVDRRAGRLVEFDRRDRRSHAAGQV